jgi:tRNA pseudouridine13 synthase
VSREAPRPPENESSLGLEFYITTAPGVPGRIKGSAEDFRVNEISSYPRPDPEGTFTILRVTSRNWEQHELANAIARRLGLGPHAVAWSGTKDRRAVAERLFSYRGPPPGSELGLRDVEVLEAYRAREGLVLGHHFGNAFEIRVGELAVPVAEAVDRYRAVGTELRDAGGFPNFFGAQRFGEVRPITQEVGRWIVRGDLVQAVEVYLAARPAGGRPGVGDEARGEYAQHHDAARALREFPPEYTFERALLEHLAKGHDAERALRALSRELRLLFVHAYQSLLFNRWLSRRFHAGLPLTEPVEGDWILRVGREGTVRGQDVVPVARDNLPECAELVRRGGAMVAGPLVGFGTPLEGGPVGDLLRTLLAEEGLRPEDWKLPKTPEIASRGAWRPILLGVPPLGITAGEGHVDFRFALPKGAYATVFLREFLKSGAPV